LKLLCILEAVRRTTGSVFPSVGVREPVIERVDSSMIVGTNQDLSAASSHSQTIINNFGGFRVVKSHGRSTCNTKANDENPRQKMVTDSFRSAKWEPVSRMERFPLTGTPNTISIRSKRSHIFSAYEHRSLQ